MLEKKGGLRGDIVYIDTYNFLFLKLLRFQWIVIIVKFITFNGLLVYRT